jgi:phosphatidylglycerol:prolipoprotein diacylglycerol transferase
LYPVLFRVFGIPIRSYGLMLILGFVVGSWIAGRRCARYGLNKDQTLDLALIVMLAGVVGARLLYVLLNWADYSASPVTVLYVWEGGLSYFGGLVAGFLGALLYVLKQNLRFWAVADLVAPSIAIGYAITRIGCFLNGCCYGRPTDLPWACKFHSTPVPVHPAQIYASLANLLIFAILIWWARRSRFDGQIFFGFLFLHGVYRFLNEFVRAGATASYIVDSLTGGGRVPPAFIPSWMTLGQAASLAVCLVAVIGYFLLRRMSRRGSAAGDVAS